MLLDSPQFNNRGSGYPSYGGNYHSALGEKTPPLSDASTADSRAAIPLDRCRGEYAPEYADSGYYVHPKEVERAQMAAMSYYMHAAQAAYGQPIYGNHPPTHGGQSSYAYADAPRSVEQPAAHRGAPGAVPTYMIPQAMPTPMPVHFQVPPGYMLVPLDQLEAAPPQNRPPPANKHSLAQGLQSRGSDCRERVVSRPRPKQGRPTGQKVSKIFVGGLSPLSTVETLRDHFSKYGEIVDVAVILEPTTRKSRGFGYVEFADGIPEGLLDIAHYVDSRRCGVRPYEYNPEDKA